MDSDNPVPRVNFGTMERYMHQKVKLVCKVDQVGSGQVRATTSDNAQVTIITAPNQPPYDTLYVEVEGQVENAGTIREEEHTNFGDNFGGLPARACRCARARATAAATAADRAACPPADLNLYNEMIKLSHGNYGSLFRA